MKRTLFLARMTEIAAAAGLECELVRQGGRHEIWRVGPVMVPVPRHRDINERTALSALADLERTLSEEG